MRWLPLALVVAASCGPQGKPKGNPGTPDGGGSNTPDGPPQVVTDAGPDASCGAQEQQIGIVNLGDPPDLLVVLDRSGSMVDPPVTFPPVFDSKWNIMKTALEQITAQKDQNIRFGLLEFPSDDNCAADSVAEVPVGLGSHTGFDAYFAVRAPNGNTPAHIALGSALAYFQTIPVNMAGRYVLFATDGLPNCLNGDGNMTSYPETVAAVTGLYNSGIKTFVLGFGTFGLNTGVLNDAAVAGGEARTGPTKFYEANNAQDLATALNAIAGGIIVPSCSFQLQSPPPDPNNVTVLINGVAVPRSTQHTMGWDYYPDAMTITFFGSYCDEIKMGATTDVKFLYGCPGPIIN